MRGTVCLGLLIGLGLVLAPQTPSAGGEGTGALERYLPPQDLEVRCQRLPDPPGGAWYRLEGRVTLRIGRARALRPFVTVSPDLQLVASLPGALEIASGQVVRLPFLVRKGSPTGLARETWVKVGVEYHPDYDAILTHVRRATRRYSDARLRHRLLDELRQADRAAKPVTAVFSLYPREDDLLESQGIRFSASTATEASGGEAGR